MSLCRTCRSAAAQSRRKTGASCRSVAAGFIWLLRPWRSAGKGELVGVLETLRDLRHEEAEAKFRSLAGVDALTGIANRRTFDDLLGAEWPRAVRSGEALSLLMIDVDHFKLFNDCLGHQRGDDCLRLVAEAMAGEARRAGDFPARYGGEEFAMVLPPRIEPEPRLSRKMSAPPSNASRYYIR